MQTSESHLFTLSHICHAPCELVWKAWSEAEHLQNWFRMQGEMSIIPLPPDQQPEDELRYSMTAADGSQIWGKWVFVEIIPIERLAVIITYTDKNDNIARYPQLRFCPLETLVAFEFREQGNKTLITIEATPYLASEDEITAFDLSHIDMTQHWRGCFDRLDTYMEQLQ